MPNTMQIVEQQLNAGTCTLNQLRYLDSHYTLVVIAGVWYVTDGVQQVALQKFLPEKTRALRTAGAIGPNTTATINHVEIAIKKHGQRIWVVPNTVGWEEHVCTSTFLIGTRVPTTVEQLKAVCRGTEVSPVGTKRELWARLLHTLTEAQLRTLHSSHFSGNLAIPAPFEQIMSDLVTVNA